MFTLTMGSPFRNPNAPIEEYAKRGSELFGRVYGESGTRVQKLLDDSYPDMGVFDHLCIFLWL